MPWFNFHLLENGKNGIEVHGRELPGVDAAIDLGRSIAAVYAHGRSVAEAEAQDLWLEIAGERGEQICLSLHGLLTWSSHEVTRFTMCEPA